MQELKPASPILPTARVGALGARLRQCNAPLRISLCVCLCVRNVVGRAGRSGPIERKATILIAAPLAPRAHRSSHFLFGTQEGPGRCRQKGQGWREGRRPGKEAQRAAGVARHDEGGHRTQPGADEVGGPGSCGQRCVKVSGMDM